MPDAPVPRLGVVRPIDAGDDRLTAEIEARVVSAELRRRLGPVDLDLRSAGTAVGPWAPRATAPWPAAIDAELDISALWAGGVPPLAALFGRTVEAAAIEARAAMLAHLGLVPDDELGIDPERHSQLRSIDLSPTDMWLIVQRAARVTVDDPTIVALGAPVDGDAASVDQAFDAVVARFDMPEIGPRFTTLLASNDELRRTVAERDREIERIIAQTTARFEALETDRRLLADRLARAELDAELATDHR